MANITIAESTLDINFAVIRDWQDLRREVYEMVGNRTSLGNLLVKGIHENILERGYNIRDKNSQELVHEKELTLDLRQEVNEKYTKARKAFKQFGMSVLTYFKYEDNDAPILYWLEDTHITDLDTESGTKTIKKLAFRPPITNKLGNLTPVNVPTKELENFRLLSSYDTKMGEFRPWLEPVMDRLIGWAILFQQLTLLEIRDGSGIRYIIAPASELADATTRAEYEQILENLGYNTLLSIGDDAEIGKNVEFGIKFAEGTSSVDYPASMDMHLVPIAIHTGYTKEYLKGNEMGMRASEKNRQKSNEAERKEENKMKGDLGWCYGKLLSCELCLDGTHEISFDIKEELDETEKLKNDEVSFRILSTTPWEKLGLRIEDVMERFGIDLPIDMSLIEKYKADQEALNASIMKGSPDDNGNGISGKDKEKTLQVQDKPKPKAN